MTRLLLDDGFPLPLAAELRARGRDAVHVRELGWEAARDEELEREGLVQVADAGSPPAGVRLDVWLRDWLHVRAAALGSPPLRRPRPKGAP